MSRRSAIYRRPVSSGETAKMALARLLMRDYELLILDEPTAAMDVESALAAEALLSDYCRDTGAGILLVTHSLQQARRIAPGSESPCSMAGDYPCGFFSPVVKYGHHNSGGTPHVEKA